MTSQTLQTIFDAAKTEKLTTELNEARARLQILEDAEQRAEQFRQVNLDLDRKLGQQTPVINVSVFFAAANLLFYVAWPLLQLLMKHFL